VVTVTHDNPSEAARIQDGTQCLQLLDCNVLHIHDVTVWRAMFRACPTLCRLFVDNWCLHGLRALRYKLPLDTHTVGRYLYHCTRLRQLTVRGWKLGDNLLLVPPALMHLDFRNTQITPVQLACLAPALRSLALWRLDMSPQHLDRVVALQHLHNLQLWNTQVHSLEPLQNARCLQRLYLHASVVTEATWVFRTLLLMPRLHTLDLTNAQLHGSVHELGWYEPRAVLRCLRYAGLHLVGPPITHTYKDQELTCSRVRNSSKRRRRGG
jgi:hypothetical protein